MKTPTEYKIMKREVLYQGIFRLARYHIRFHLYQGGESNLITREVFEREPVAALLPYDPLLDKVILIEQFRAGPLNQQKISPWLIEIVAGSIKPDETPAELAIREAKEEANCDILDIYPICEYFVSPGGSNEFLSLFCGRVDASAASGIHGLIEEEEDIRVFTVSVEEALKLITNGQIKTSPAIISLLWLQLNRERLKQLWQTK